MAKELPNDGRTITKAKQYRKCGKASCRTCRMGKRHGPYLYFYWRENGILKSKYGGKWETAARSVKQEG